MTEQDGISVGVLIIGSLYWDLPEHRKRWRAERLDLDAKRYVRAPIRYGRRSSSRGCSYTMVFSTGLPDGKFGRAIAAPCTHRVKNSCDLIEEARLLWMAERPAGALPGPVSADWGCVALVANPDRPVPEHLSEAWRAHVSRQKDYGLLRSGKDEPAVVDGVTGFLQIPWPKSDGDLGLDVDLLLATATSRKSPKCPADGDNDPCGRQVADAWNTVRGRDHVDYFWKNRAHGIRTFQDCCIADRLLQLWQLRSR